MINKLKTILLSISLILVSSFTTSSQTVFKVPGTVFDTDVIVIVTRDTAKARKLCEHYTEKRVETEYFESRALTVYSSGYPVVVWIPYFIATPERFSILNHEIMHVVTAVLQWAGVPLTDKTEEVYAFLVQHYTKEIYEFLLKNPLR